MRHPSRFVLAVPVLLATFQLVPALAQDAATEAPVAPPAEKVELKVKFEDGARFRHLNKVHMDQTIEMGGAPMATVFDLTSTLDQVYLGAKEGGGSNMRVTNGRVHGGIDNPMFGSVSFDSSKPAEESGNPMIDGMVKGMLAMADASVELTLDDAGKVTEVRGIDALVKRLTDINPMAAMQPGMEDDLKQSFTAIYPQLPTEPVGVGSTWTATRDQGMQGAKMTVTIDFEVTEITAEAVIAKGAVKAVTTGAIMGGMATLGDGKGTTKASFSRADGLLLEQTTTMAMGIDMSAMTGQPGGGSMSMRSTVTRVKAPAGADKPITGGESTDDGVKKADAE